MKGYQTDSCHMGYKSKYYITKDYEFIERREYMPFPTEDEYIEYVEENDCETN